jgi:hypothetical protein
MRSPRLPNPDDLPEGLFFSLFICCEKGKTRADTVTNQPEQGTIIYIIHSAGEETEWTTRKSH